MTIHFFQKELTAEQKARLKAVFDEASVARRREAGLSLGNGDDSNGGELTPAIVEQVAGEHEDVDEFLAALEGLPEAGKMSREAV